VKLSTATPACTAGLMQIWLGQSGERTEKPPWVGVSVPASEGSSHGLPMPLSSHPVARSTATSASPLAQRLGAGRCSLVSVLRFLNIKELLLSCRVLRRFNRHLRDGVSFSQASSIKYLDDGIRVKESAVSSPNPRKPVAFNRPRRGVLLPYGDQFSLPR
jgi:hypothetical protein